MVLTKVKEFAEAYVSTCDRRRRRYTCPSHKKILSIMQGMMQGLFRV